ncbi:MAG TPA: hypothetical protein VK961_23375 [Chthoniobacter sp.]|nr:hypothetical protein [Chthoniobacter sp.]
MALIAEGLAAGVVAGSVSITVTPLGAGNAAPRWSSQKMARLAAVTISK